MSLEQLDAFLARARDGLPRRAGLRPGRGRGMDRRAHRLRACGAGRWRGPQRQHACTPVCVLQAPAQNRKKNCSTDCQAPWVSTETPMFQALEAL